MNRIFQLSLSQILNILTCNENKFSSNYIHLNCEIKIYTRRKYVKLNVHWNVLLPNALSSDGISIILSVHRKFAQQSHLDNTRSCESFKGCLEVGSVSYVHRGYVSNNIFHVRRRCKLKLIYNSGSPTRHDFVLAAKQTPPSPPDYVTFPREQLCETSGPGANRSDTFHTFHSIFNIHRCIPEVWSYYPPERERERERLDSTSARAVVVRIVHSARFPSLLDWWRIS